MKEVLALIAGLRPLPPATWIHGENDLSFVRAPSHNTLFIVAVIGPISRKGPELQSLSGYPQISSIRALPRRERYFYLLDLKSTQNLSVFFRTSLKIVLRVVVS